MAQNTLVNTCTGLPISTLGTVLGIFAVLGSALICYLFVPFSVNCQLSG